MYEFPLIEIVICLPLGRFSEGLVLSITPFPLDLLLTSGADARYIRQRPELSSEFLFPDTRTRSWSSRSSKRRWTLLLTVSLIFLPALGFQPNWFWCFGGPRRLPPLITWQSAAASGWRKEGSRWRQWNPNLRPRLVLQKGFHFLFFLRIHLKTFLILQDIYS